MAYWVQRHIILCIHWICEGLRLTCHLGLHVSFFYFVVSQVQSYISNWNLCIYSHTLKTNKKKEKKKKKTMGILLTLPSVRPFVCLSRYIQLNHWADFKLLPLMLRVCKSNIIFSCISVSSVCPSVSHAISSITTGRNSTKLATWPPLVVRVCESNIIFTSICLSQYLRLN